MISTFKKFWSSSAPRENLDSDPIDKPADMDTVMGGLDAQSPNTYEDALEEVNGNEDGAQPATLPEPLSKSAKTKKTKKAKKAKQSEESVQQEDDLDPSQQVNKLGDDAAGLTGGEKAQFSQWTPVNGISSAKKNTKRPKNSLSKRDLKLLQQNKENGIDPHEEAEALANPELAELPAKIKKVKKSRAKSQEAEPDSTPAEPRVEDDEEDDSAAILHQQLTPAKPMPPLDRVAPEEPIEVDGILAEPEGMDVDIATAATAKRGKRKAVPISKGESSKRSRRGKDKDTGVGDIRAMLDQQENLDDGSEAASVSLKELARRSYMEFAEEKSSPPRSTNSSFSVVLPTMARTPKVDWPLSSSSKTAGKSKKETKPRASRSLRNRNSGFTAINARDTPEIPVEQGEFEDEPEAEAEVGAEPESVSRSSRRKRRRLPVQDEDHRPKALENHNIKASKKPRKSSERPNGIASQTTPKTPANATPAATRQPSSSQISPISKQTQVTAGDRAKMKAAVDVWREMEDLDEDELIALIQADLPKKGRTNFWDHVHAEVPDLTRRKVVDFCRRNFHKYERGPWTEQQVHDLEMVVEKLNNQGTQLVGFWKVAGELLNRYPADCRDRWRTYSTCKDRKLGPWSHEEESRLREVVKEMQENSRQTHAKGLPSGNFDPDYSLLSKKFGGTRSRLQVMNKWKAIRERERADADDPSAKAPLSTTPWRQIPALEKARAMSADEKYQILTSVRASGAVREGKIPWKTFPGHTGKSLIWKSFLRGAMYSIPDYEEMDLQERVSYLIDKLDNQGSVEINDSVGEFARLSQRHERALETYRSGGGRKVKRSNDSEEEKAGGSTPRKIRRRMKKQGESQETVDGEQVEEEANGSDAAASAMEEIRSSQKKGKSPASKNKSLATVLNEESDIEEPETTSSHKKKRSTKKSKKAKSAEKVVEDPEDDDEAMVNGITDQEHDQERLEVEQDHSTLMNSGPDHEATANALENDEVIDASSSKPKKTKKTKKAKKAFISEDQDMLQDSGQPEVLAASASQEKKKKKKAKKNSLFDEAPVEDVEDYDYVDPYKIMAEQQLEKKKSKKSKIVAQPVEDPIEEPVEESVEEGAQEVIDNNQEVVNGDQEHIEEDQMDIDHFQRDTESPAHNNLEDPQDPIEDTQPDEPLADLSGEEPVVDEDFEEEAEDHHDQESLDLDTTENIIAGLDENSGENSELEQNGVQENEGYNGFREDEDLDEEHEITVNGFRDPSPEVESTSREIRESSIPRAPTPPSAQPQVREKRDKKRKRLSSRHEHVTENGERSRKKKKKTGLRLKEAQDKWEQLQPKSSLANEYESARRGSLSSSDGSDTSIPARVRPTKPISTSAIPTPKRRMNTIH